MTEESAKGKLTLSGKSTLTLKNLNKSPAADGKKVVQVEVRKKRVINQTAQAAPKKEIDEATAQKLKLLAEAKEHDAKRRQEEEIRNAQRLKLQEERAKAQPKQMPKLRLKRLKKMLKQLKSRQLPKKLRLKPHLKMRVLNIV